MTGYLKLKSIENELYESEYLNELENKKAFISRMQYHICKYYYKFLAKIKYYLNIITVKQVYNAYILILPLKSISENNRMKKCINNVQKIIKQYNIQTLVIEEKLKKNPVIGQMIQNEEKKVHILDGRGVMPYLVKEIFEFLLEKYNTKLEMEDLCICVKEYKPLYIDNILHLLHYCKNINIITKNIKQFQTLADKIEEKENIIITVTNNKKKSLKKSKLIVNFDFEEEELKKYTIFREAIILTINENGFYESSTYSGIQIRNVEIDTSEDIKEFFSKYNLLEGCSLTTLYESLMNKKENFEQIKSRMEADEIRIIKLYGKNGILWKLYEFSWQIFKNLVY